MAGGGTSELLVVSGRIMNRTDEVQRVPPQIRAELHDAQGRWIRGQVIRPRPQRPIPADGGEALVVQEDQPGLRRQMEGHFPVGAHELPHEAIAQELGISVAAAKVRLHRGRKKLRDLLDDMDDGRSARAV